ncbi:MAG: 50S ribosomal protein L5 [Pyramidobacter sp.]|jgi:large subunit ribosomal protein L5|nr:50S ribosomal protein L5 [Pyramidobacter sp.]MBO6267073.1 50S ribosomal protein L5 [Synergistaceae bacterium]MBP3752665.1 50S ribosomal protein L5 [Pyramidobacter sp.]MBP3835948.1 50S ribosomal protein L5 [Pyramidobacter sp.]MBP3848697.1 50S ribosomal protein L5 [Pyramidobacter sp.]
MTVPVRVLEKYKTEVVPAMQAQFSYKNPMMMPKIVKVVINIGVGDAKTDSKFIDAAVSELATISGQKPMIKKSKKSIANFKLREGTPVGCCVTLRGTRMWEFLDRLMNLTLARIKDFQGVSRTSFDGRGNYNLGLKEQLIFPEINYDKVIKLRGMNITIVTTAGTDEEAFVMLEKLGMPFAHAE